MKLLRALLTALAVLAGIVFGILMMAATAHAQGFGAAMVPQFDPVYNNANGAGPAALGYLCSFAAGTTTPQATYTDDTLNTPNQNPIRLSAGGRPVNGSSPVSIFLSPTQYKFNLYANGTGNTCNGTSVGALIRSVDNVYDVGALIQAGLIPIQVLNNRVYCPLLSLSIASLDAAFTIAAAKIPSTGGVVDCSNIQGTPNLSSDTFHTNTKPILFIWPTGDTFSSVSFTMPASITSEFYKGGMVTMATATTATFVGEVRGTIDQHFAGSGAVIVESNPVYNQWFSSLSAALASGAEVHDVSDSGRLSIRTNPTSVTTGSSAGISVRVGSSTYSNTNPPSGAPVAGYFALDTTLLNNSSGGTAGVTGVNSDILVDAGADAYTVSNEADINNNGSSQQSLNANLPKYGYRVSSGGKFSLTAAYSIDANPTAGQNFHGYSCNSACATDILTVAPSPTTAPLSYSWSFGEAVSSGNKTFVTTYNTTNQNGLHVDSTIHIPAGGGTQENVTITAIVTTGTSTGGATCSATTACITGTFGFSHNNGTTFYPFTAVRGIDFGNGIFAGSIFRVGDIQRWNSSGSNVLLGQTVNDSAGTERFFQWFRSDNTTVYRELGSGWRWESSNAVLAATMDPSGNSVIQGTQTASYYATTTNCGSIASPAVCAAAPMGHVVVAAGTTSVVVDTTAVNAGSEIMLSRDDSLGSLLGVTCNTQSSLVLGTPRVTARSASASFTITVDAGPTSNPMCINYTIIN